MTQINDINFYAEFATKEELGAVNRKTDDLIKATSGMSVAIEILTEAVNKININLESLIHKKSVNDTLKVYAFKVLSIVGSIFGGIIMTILTAHWTGLTKIFGKWLLS